MNVLVAIYADLELYPPSLNAVRELASRVDEVHVVLRGMGQACVDLPENVIIHRPIQLESMDAILKLTALEKVRDFARFVHCLRVVQSKVRPSLVLAYDPLPLMALRLAGVKKWPGILWYHNHDKEAHNPNRFLTIGWWAYTTESGAFKSIDFFTVPALERLPYFRTRLLKSAPVLIPNYPSKHQAGRQTITLDDDVLRLVYQGSLGRHHGFQEIIPWLDRTVGGRTLHLTLVGKIDRTFHDELLELAKSSGVSDRFEIRGFAPHKELPAILSKFHVGLAIHKPVGVTYSTGGTACNKIFEYAAVGLPVVLYDSPHYRDHLGGRYWVVFCTLDWLKFSTAIELSLVDFSGKSKAAMADFNESLNFERVFVDVWNQILLLLEKQKIVVK